VPIIAFPFFLGYSLHLLSDAWTVEGIKPFWPLKTVSQGKIRTGGVTEHTVLFTFIIIDVVLTIFLFI
jgi:membrane-bound metal-dependent hydrolase YbcI (DUF457 family)